MVETTETGPDAAMRAALVQPDDQVREWAEEAIEGGYSHVSVVRPETILSLLDRATLRSTSRDSEVREAIEAARAVAGAWNAYDSGDMDDLRLALTALDTHSSEAAPTRCFEDFTPEGGSWGPCAECGSEAPHVRLTASEAAPTEPRYTPDASCPHCRDGSPHHPASEAAPNE